MIEGHVPQPRLEDLKPTRLHWVWLGTAALAQAVIYLAVTSHWDVSSFQKITAAMVWSLAGVSVFGWLLGAPPGKIYADWRDRNLSGYFWVLWQTEPNHLKGHFVNSKNLPSVIMSGWSLHVPLGGWFNRPFLSHSEDKPRRSQNFRITRVKWDWCGAVATVTVTDNAGDRITVHPSTIIGQLEAHFPTGDRGMWLNGILALQMANTERDRRALGRTKEHLADFHQAVRDGVSDLDHLCATINGGDRLKNTKEGKAVPFVVGFAFLLGGPRKLSQAWLWRNYRGFDLVYWLKKNDEVEGSIHPTTERTQQWEARCWKLRIPLGGWFQKPEIHHDTSRGMHGLRIVQVAWERSTGIVSSVTVEDNLGNRLSLNPFHLLLCLQAYASNAEDDGLAQGALLVLFQRSDTLTRELGAAAKERSRDFRAEQESRLAAQTQVHKLDELLRATVADIGTMLSEYDTSSRLNKQKEAQRLMEGDSGFVGMRHRHAAIEKNRRMINGTD